MQIFIIKQDQRSHIISSFNEVRCHPSVPWGTQQVPGLPKVDMEIFQWRDSANILFGSHDRSHNQVAIGLDEL